MPKETDGTPTGQAPAGSTICLLVGHGTNREVLADWLSAVDQYEVTGEAACNGSEGTPGPTDLVDGGVDLCLVDDDGVSVGAGALREWKDRTDVARPVLLLTERRETALPDDVRSLVDDVVAAPTDQATLEGRLDRLLWDRERSRQFDAERRRLQDQNERLRRFASRLSHDLRNPLGIAQGYVGEARDEGEVAHLDVVEDALERMERLVDETLTLAKMGETAIDRESVSLRDVAETAWGHVDTDGATLTVVDHVRFEADGGRLLALFENLYRNAVEHAGPDAGVTVGTLPDGFYVEDDGPGIPETDREMVFEVGYTTRADGTGFGLRIVQEIAEAHGWSVAATGCPGGGARFEMTGVDVDET